MYVYIYIYICIYVHICICIFICIYVYICIYNSVYKYKYMLYIYVYIKIYIILYFTHSIARWRRFRACSPHACMMVYTYSICYMYRNPPTHQRTMLAHTHEPNHSQIRIHTHTLSHTLAYARTHSHTHTHTHDSCGSRHAMVQWAVYTYTHRYYAKTNVPKNHLS